MPDDIHHIWSIGRNHSLFPNPQLILLLHTALAHRTVPVLYPQIPTVFQRHGNFLFPHPKSMHMKNKNGTHTYFSGIDHPRPQIFHIPSEADRIHLLKAIHVDCFFKGDRSFNGLQLTVSFISHVQHTKNQFSPDHTFILCRLYIPNVQPSLFLDQTLNIRF